MPCARGFRSQEKICIFRDDGDGVLSGHCLRSSGASVACVNCTSNNFALDAFHAPHCTHLGVFHLYTMGSPIWRYRYFNDQPDNKRISYVKFQISEIGSFWELLTWQWQLLKVPKIFSYRNHWHSQAQNSNWKFYLEHWRKYFLYSILCPRDKS